MPAQVQCLQPVLYRNDTDPDLPHSGGESVRETAFSLSILALSSPRTQADTLLSAASLSPRLASDSLLEISKKEYSYVGQSQSSIFCQWRSCHTANVHRFTILILHHEMGSA